MEWWEYVYYIVLIVVFAVWAVYSILESVGFREFVAGLSIAVYWPITLLIMLIAGIVSTATDRTKKKR